jgi:hypothetical protein
MAMGSRSCSDARRTFDAESLAASPDQNLPTGSNTARGIRFRPLVRCLVHIAERLIEVHHWPLGRASWCLLSSR